MCGLEVIAAIVAETLIEMGVLILTEPAEIYWPNGLVSKLSGQTHTKKKGKITQNTKHGIFGELVSTLAPSIPLQSGSNKDATKVAKNAKGFKPPVKNKPTETLSTNAEIAAQAMEGGGGDSDTVHQGIAAQGHRGVLL